MELFSDSTCCNHAWACYPTEMRCLVVTYKKSERTWTIPMPLTWMVYIFLMADDCRGSLIEIYIGLPRIFKALLRFYVEKQPFYRLNVTKSASNVYTRRDVQLFSIIHLSVGKYPPLLTSTKVKNSIHHTSWITIGNQRVTLSVTIYRLKLCQK